MVRVREIILRAQEVLPFDELAAEVYGPLRARLESEGRRLDEPDLRIASIVLARDLTLVRSWHPSMVQMNDVAIALNETPP